MDANAVAAERGETTVVLSGPVTLAEVPRWRDTLHRTFAAGRPVHIDLAAAGPWDPAGLQLVISAVAAGRSGGAPVRLVRVPGVFLAIAEQAGATDWLANAIDTRVQ